VALDDPGQGLVERLQRRPAVEGEERLLQVGIALVGEVMVQQPFLQRRQGVDLLHIGRAARNRADDLVDAGLVEVGQGQHLGGDALATRRHAVGRYRLRGGAAERRGEAGQGRLAEQHLGIGVQPCLAHALDQAYRQQRMATQFEEVIMPPDLLYLQQLGP